MQIFTQDLQTPSLQFKQQKAGTAQQLRQLMIAGHQPLVTSDTTEADHLKLMTPL